MSPQSSPRSVEMVSPGSPNSTSHHHNPSRRRIRHLPRRGDPNYTDFRDRNNAALHKHRQKKREKERHQLDAFEQLKRENDQLSTDNDELEREIRQLEANLMQRAFN